MNRFFKPLLLALLFSFTLFGCGKNAAVKDEGNDNPKETEASAAPSENDAAEAKERESITILFTNDIHGYIANAIKTDDGEESPALRLSNISRMKQDFISQGKNVLLADAGDVIQGNIYGAIDEGESLMGLMNAAGYDIATMGNHEFDYGMFRFFEVTDMADFPYISCNFRSLEEGGGHPFDASRIFEFGDTSLAFIGITTPRTITSSTPVYFQNEKGEYIYHIDGLDSAEELYSSVQTAIDEVRGHVDYVIALGHVGVAEDEIKDGLSSLDIIENTTGLDAFIDGHSHTLVEGNTVKDKSGEGVVLAQTGAMLSHVGQMDIAPDGSISITMHEDYENTDEKTEELEEKLIQKVVDKYGQKVATLETELYITNPDIPDQRIIRSRETNAGDFIADSYYWYFNEYKQMNCDMAMINGGGIRSNIKSGEVKGSDIKNVSPFGNMICMIYATGQQIKDALEMGTTVTGEWNEEWDSPAENGSFQHVAGIRYTIDSTVESSVEVNAEDEFLEISGDYRVKDLQVYNRDLGIYEDMDMEKVYTIGGINYSLRNGGGGLTMFRNNELVIDYVGEDVDIETMYFQSFAKGDDDYPLINTKNSPLISYDGYLIDYENPYGAGRINIIMED